MCKKVGQSSLLHNKLLFGHVIFIHTHTQGIAMETSLQVLPPCLLCCYSSHPRIVFFFFLTHSLVFVTHSLQWKPHNSIGLLFPFFPDILFSTKGTACHSESSACAGVCPVSQRVHAREQELRGIPKRLPIDELLW